MDKKLKLSSEFKLKLKKSGLALTDKNLSLAMNVDPTAGACAEVTDFYQRSLLPQTSADNFNNVPFNKGKKRIPMLNTGNVLKPWTCTFDGSDIDLSAREVEVSKFAIMVEICISDIEDSFLVDQMAKGANNDVNPADFLAYVWQHIGDRAGEEIEMLRWNGDRSLIANPLLKLMDGYLVQLEDNPLVATVDAVATITPTNVVDELYKAIALVDPINRRTTNLNELKIFVSSDVMLAFAVATSQNTSIGGYVSNTGDSFLGRYKLIEVPALPARTMVLAPKQDLVYTYDLLSDPSDFITVNRRESAAEEMIRFRVNVYIGFEILDGSNVVYYRPVPVP